MTFKSFVDNPKAVQKCRLRFFRFFFWGVGVRFHLFSLINLKSVEWKKRRKTSSRIVAWKTLCAVLYVSWIYLKLNHMCNFWMFACVCVCLCARSSARPRVCVCVCVSGSVYRESLFWSRGRYLACTSARLTVVCHLYSLTFLHICYAGCSYKNGTNTR